MAPAGGADRSRVGPAEDVVQLPAAPRRNRTAAGLADLRRELLENCEKVASGIKISGAKLYDLVPSKTYAAGLSSTLAALSKTKNVASQALTSAKTHAAQAKAARQVAAAYATVAKDVKKLKATPYAQPVNQEIYKALVTSAGAYRTLASAAAAKSSSRYAAASKKVSSAEQELSNAIDGLKDLGYSLS